MAVSYESMSLQEIFHEGKKAGIAVPLHLRGPNAVHDPKLLEEARQYLIVQLSALHARKLAERTQKIAIVTLFIALATLAMVVFFYLYPPESIVNPPVLAAIPLPAM